MRVEPLQGIDDARKDAASLDSHNMTPIEAATHIGFGIGSADNVWDAINAVGDELGCAEFVAYAQGYGRSSSALYNTGYSRYGDCPGMYQYEVLEAFAAEFVLYAIKYHEVMPERVGNNILKRLDANFWAQFTG